MRWAPLRSGNVKRFLSRQVFHASTPSFNLARCSGLAMRTRYQANALVAWAINLICLRRSQTRDSQTHLFYLEPPQLPSFRFTSLAFTLPSKPALFSSSVRYSPLMPSFARPLHGSSEATEQCSY